MPNEDYKSAEDFVKKLDAGELDESLHVEIGKLTSDQRSEVARILMEREKHRSMSNGTD